MLCVHKKCWQKCSYSFSSLEAKDKEGLFLSGFTNILTTYHKIVINFRYDQNWEGCFDTRTFLILFWWTQLNQKECEWTELANLNHKEQNKWNSSKCCHFFFFFGPSQMMQYRGKMKDTVRFSMELFIHIPRATSFSFQVKKCDF